jgi:hypothetical protein
VTDWSASPAGTLSCEPVDVAHGAVTAIGPTSMRSPSALSPDDSFRAQTRTDRAIAVATKRSCAGRQLLATDAKRDKPRLEHEARPERRAGLLGRRSGVDARRSRSIAIGQAGRVRRRGGQDRSGRRRVASMASRTFWPVLSPHRRCRLTASLRSRPGRFVRTTTLRPPHSTSFIALCPKLRDRACRYDVVIGVSQTAQEPPCRLLLNAVCSGA